MLLTSILNATRPCILMKISAEQPPGGRKTWGLINPRAARPHSPKVLAGQAGRPSHRPSSWKRTCLVFLCCRGQGGRGKGLTILGHPPIQTDTPPPRLFPMLGDGGQSEETKKRSCHRAPPVCSLPTSPSKHQPSPLSERCLPRCWM